MGVEVVAASSCQRWAKMESQRRAHLELRTVVVFVALWASVNHRPVGKQFFHCTISMRPQKGDASGILCVQMIFVSIRRIAFHALLGTCMGCQSTFLPSDRCELAHRSNTKVCTSTLVLLAAYVFDACVLNHAAIC